MKNINKTRLALKTETLRSLDNQQLSVSAWVRADGPSTYPDQFGSIIMGKDTSGTTVSIKLGWS